MADGEPPPPSPPHGVIEKPPTSLVFGSLLAQEPIVQQKHLITSQKLAPKSSYAEILCGFSTKKIEYRPYDSGLIKVSNIDGVCNGLVNLKPTTKYLGKPAVIFSNSDKLSLIQRMKYVLVAKFSHGKPGLAIVKEFFTNFNLKSRCNISVYDSKHLILECEAFDDFVKIWMCKNCMVGGFLMRIFKWREDFHPSFESPICPVWVHLPGLPLYLYHEDILMSIANAIGRPLALDLDNVNRSKLGCARFCVEVDISMEVIDKIWIAFDKADPCIGTKGLWQKVIFDPLPPYCNRCSHLGHPIDRCLRLDNLVHNEVRGVNVEGEGQSRGESGRLGLQDLKGFQQNLSVKNYEQNASQEDHSQDKTDKERSGRYRTDTSVTQTEKGPENVVSLIRQVEGSAADGFTQSGKHHVPHQAHVQQNHPQNAKIVAEAGAIQSTRHQEAATRNVTGLVLNDGSAAGFRLTAGAIYAMGFAADAEVEQDVESDTETASGAEIRTARAVTQTNLNAEKTMIEEDTILKQQKRTDDSGVEEKDQTFTVQGVSNTGMEGQKQATRLDISESYMGQIAPGFEVNQTTEPLPTRNSFAALNEEVPIEDLALEEGEIVVAVEEADTETHGTAANSDSLIPVAAAQQESCGADVVSFGAPGDVAAKTDVKAEIEHHNDEVLIEVLHNAAVDSVRQVVQDGQDFQDRRDTIVVQDAVLQDDVGTVIDHAVKVGTAVAVASVAGEQTVAGERRKLNRELMPNNTVTPRKLSSAAVEFTPKCASILAEIGAGRSTVQTNMLSRTVDVEEKSANAGGQVVMVTDYAMEQLNERMRRLRGDSLPAAPSLVASTWVPPSMSKHLARELKKIRKQHRSNQNWQDIEDVSDEESEEGELDEKAGSQMLHGEAFLSDGMGDIPRPFKIKSAPNSPKGRNSSYDSSTYLLSRGLF